jgi:UPF0716 protein FxsA
LRVLFILFLVLPILEIWLLLKVGSVIGGLPTVGLVVLTAIAGVALLRQQSLATVLRARGKLEHGEAPIGEMAEGIFLAVGGALLLTPGFVTDFLGFCCLLPGVRRALLSWGIRQFFGRAAPPPQGAGFRQQSHREGGGHTIEGEYRRENDHERDRDREDDPHQGPRH